MSEEHLHSRESSPVVSLPGGENGTNPQVPTKMAEVFPPLAGEVEKVLQTENGSTMDSKDAALVGIKTEGVKANGGNNEMAVDDDEKQTDQANPGMSSSLPTLQEQFEIIKGKHNMTDIPRSILRLAHASCSARFGTCSCRKRPPAP